jgi:hypothetical protein
VVQFFSRESVFKGEKMDNIQIDLLTVFIAAVLNMLIGWLWYSKWLFGPAWMKCEKVNEKDCCNKMSLLYGFIVSLVIAFFLSLFEGYLGVTTVSDGMFVGFCAWLGFVATTQINAVIWGRAPLKLFVIHSGSKLLSYLVMSGVIGA